ncbi:MAG TPA: isoaspartyl peptidase/L-asparaginase [Chitinophagaceae bacterium]|nr:isoaspartyl peptidase/L-asparaginase [Chitinophagaceae bacterium]
MRKIAIAIHGGAGPDSELIRKNIEGYTSGLEKAIRAGYEILEAGGSAVEAVEEAIKLMEDDPLFNAGRGSALNNKGEVEMCASIMNGKTKKSGAAAIIKNVKNPVSLARYIMEKTEHVLVGGIAASELAIAAGLEPETDAYFVTAHQYDSFMEERDKKSVTELLKKKMHSTVGAVAIDKKGNLAAATSSGGTTNALSGRIGDSAIVGCGTYANNATCAVSCTGDGEFIIGGVIAHAISSAIDLQQYDMQQACDFVIHHQNKDTKGDIGVIGIDSSGNIGISFNSEHMHRAWISADQPLQIKIY